MAQAARHDPEIYGAPWSVIRIADHWGVVLGYGVATLVVGLVLLVWPEASVTVLAVLLALQLIVGGVYRVVEAVALSGHDAGVRALVALSGGLALVVGLLVLREPLQSVVVLGMIIGAWWVVAGVVDILGALLGRGSSSRGWDVVSGMVSLVMGGFLLVYTDISLRFLVLVVGISLVLTGVVAILAALRLRAEQASSW